MLHGPLVAVLATPMELGVLWGRGVVIGNPCFKLDHGGAVINSALSGCSFGVLFYYWEDVMIMRHAANVLVAPFASAQPVLIHSGQSPMNPSAAVFAPRAQQPKPEEKWWDEHMDQLLRGPTSLNSSLPSFESPPSDRICFTVLCGTSDPASPLHSLRRHLICIIINHVVTARVHEHITETGQGISRTECTVDGMFHPGRALATAYQGDDWGTLCVEKWWGCCQQVNEMDGRDFTNAIGCQQQVGYWVH
jgi:hypothetical protein